MPSKAGSPTAAPTNVVSQTMTITPPTLAVPMILPAMIASGSVADSNTSTNFPDFSSTVLDRSIWVTTWIEIQRM